jgi:hypothetical protein
VKKTSRIIILALIIGVLAIGSQVQWNTGRHESELDSQEENQFPINQAPDETADEQLQTLLPSRGSTIPDDLVKITPEMDLNPPRSYSHEYSDPVPIPGLVNTAGGEDSAFIMPDGETLYFFFTPDVRVPVEKQLLDQVTGIYLSEKDGELWEEPERVLLQDPGKLAIDGCQFVSNDIMYFCSAKEGYAGVHWFKAEYLGGEWRNWVNADSELKTQDYSTGELHITTDGQELYFHSNRSGGKGNYDIWVSQKVDEEWGEPLNVEVVNTEGSDGWPYISHDGSELWFSRDYGIWRSKRVDGEWQEPEKMFFPLAGEPSVDSEGNVYFTHHFFEDDAMLEADIYVAYRRHLKKGVSLSPRSFSEEDFLDFFSKARQAGEIVMWAGDWQEMARQESSGPIVISRLASSYDYTPLIEVTIHSEGTLLRPLNESNKQIYLDSIVSFAAEHTPPYLGLGIEINSVYENSPEDFDEFVTFYNGAYDAVKNVSPETAVFTVFQLEKMKGHTLWSDEPADPDNPQWSLLDRFQIDLYAFTTYPGLVYRAPHDIPTDYYHEISDHVSKPVAFTELGWHSEGSPVGWESSVEEQAEFVDTFFRLTENLEMEIAIWSFLYDPEIIEPFRSMGLRNEDGTARPAWDRWLEYGS